MVRAGKDVVQGRVKEKKRQKRLLWSYVLIFLLAGIFLGLFFLSHWEKLAINQVIISGNRAVSTEEIEDIVISELAGNYFYTFSRRNIFSFPRFSIRENIMDSIPYIGDVAFDSGDNVLSVSVSEREPHALWCQEDQCYFIDQTGFAFALAPNFSDNIFLKISGPFRGDPVGAKPITGSLFNYITDSADLLPLVFKNQDLLEVEIFKVNIINRNDYEFILAQSQIDEKINWSLRFNRLNDFSRDLDNLATVLASEKFQEEYHQSGGYLEYIDLRFGNKIFYRFR